MEPNYDIEMFYDGTCPLCLRETRLLQRLDRRGRLRFTNIAAADFQAADVGKSLNQLMATIHGRLPDGSWVVGVEVFRQMYSAVGMGPLVWVTRLPIIKQVLNMGYTVFAKNRLALTGRCDDKCSINTNQASN